MTKHEKNDRAAVRQERNLATEGTEEEPLDDLEGAEELLKTSFTSGNEMKIAVAVIGILVLIFAAAMVYWLRRSPPTSPTPAEQTVVTNDRPAAAARDQAMDEADRRNASVFGPAAKAAKSNVVPAVPGPGSELKPEMGVKGPDRWSFASDVQPKTSKPEDRALPSSFQPRVAARDKDGPAGRSKELDEPKPSFGGWQQDTEVRTRLPSSPPNDPFQNRSSREAAGAGNPPSPNASPLGATVASPQAAKPQRSTEGDRWGQGFSSSADHTSAGRPGERSWVMPPGPTASPPTSEPPTRATTPGSHPIANPLRPAAPSDAVGLPPSPGHLAPLSAPTQLNAPSPRHAQSSPDSPSTLGGPTRSSLPSPNAPASRDAQSNPANTHGSSAVSLLNRGRRTYTVQNGDTLYDIARQQLGKASRWREIYELNKDLINTRWLDLEPGTQLVLPDAGPEGLTERPGMGSLR